MGFKDNYKKKTSFNLQKGRKLQNTKGRYRIFRLCKLKYSGQIPSSMTTSITLHTPWSSINTSKLVTREPWLYSLMGWDGGTSFHSSRNYDIDSLKATSHVLGADTQREARTRPSLCSWHPQWCSCIILTFTCKSHVVPLPVTRSKSSDPTLQCRASGLRSPCPGRENLEWEIWKEVPALKVYTPRVLHLLHCTPL